MRIVIRSEDPRAVRQAQGALEAAGVAATALAGPCRPAPDGEDLALFPATDANADAAARLARQALAAERPPLAALLGLPSSSPPPPGAAAIEPFLGAVALDAQAPLLAAQIEGFIRLAEIEEERLRRARTAAGFDVSLEPVAEPRTMRALYIGAPSPMFLALEAAFTRHGGLTAAAFTSFSGFDHLHDETFDAVVLNGAQSPSTALSLCAALRRNATLYNLPTLMLTAAGDKATADAALARNASAVAEAGAPCEPALGWLFEAIRCERRRAEGERQLAALRERLGDPRTGLLLAPVFEAHLQALALDAHARGCPLSLAALRVLPAHGANRPSESVWRKGFNEVSSLAARLIRSTDCGAAMDGELIALVLPGHELVGARRAAERVASVSECTAFAAGDDGSAPLVFEQSAVELQPGESGAGLLARALRAFEYESASA